jgi:hypothetical protein
VIAQHKEALPACLTCVHHHHHVVCRPPAAVAAAVAVQSFYLWAMAMPYACHMSDQMQDLAMNTAGTKQSTSSCRP